MKETNHSDGDAYPTYRDRSNPDDDVIFIDSDDPLVALWKRKVFPIFLGSIFFIVAVPLFLGVVFSPEIAFISMCYTSIAIACIGFGISTIYSLPNYFSFDDIHIEDDSVTFMCSGNKYIGGPRVCLLPFSDVAMIRWNRWSYDIVKVDGSNFKIPHAFNSSKHIRDMTMAFHVYLAETSGQDVPVYLSADDLERRTNSQSIIGRLDSSDLGEGSSKAEGFVGLITLFCILFTLIFGAEFFFELLWNRSIDMGTVSCFGGSSLLLMILFFLYRSEFEEREIHKRINGLELNENIRKGFFIVIARKNGFNEIVQDLEWDGKLRKYRESGFEESVLGLINMILFIILIPLFFFFVGSIFTIFYDVFLERLSYDELVTQSIENLPFLIILSFPLLVFAFRRLADRTIALSAEDMKKIKQLLGERYWTGGREVDEEEPNPQGCNANVEVDL